jgi:hypothetical protein
MHYYRVNLFIRFSIFIFFILHANSPLNIALQYCTKILRCTKYCTIPCGLGQDERGRITTLGRGGSDLTATVVGSAYPVDEIQVRLGQMTYLFSKYLFL